MKFGFDWTSGSLEMVGNDGHPTATDGRQMSSLREPKGSGGLKKVREKQ